MKKKKTSKKAPNWCIVRTVGEGHNYGMFKSADAADRWARFKWALSPSVMWMILPIRKVA